MAIDYLEDLESSIDRGKEWYACPGVNNNEWYLSTSLEELRVKGQRTANSRGHQIHVYRLINRADAVTGDSFLVVRRFLEPSPKGEPRMNWTLVDTREASEMMRDVSQGPSPYFGASIVETLKSDGTTAPATY